MDGADRPPARRVCDVHIGVRDEAVTLHAVIRPCPRRWRSTSCSPAWSTSPRRRRARTRLVYLVDDDRLVLRAASPVHRQFVGRLAMGFGEGVTGWVARTGAPAFIRDGALEDPRMRYFPELRRSASSPWPPSRAGAERRRGRRDRPPHRGAARVRRGGARLPRSHRRAARRRRRARAPYAEASARVHQLTSSRSDPRRWPRRRTAAPSPSATAGGRAMLGARLCQLFRLESGGQELRLLASDPPGAPVPRPRSGALALELLARGRPALRRRPVAGARGAALVAPARRLRGAAGRDVLPRRRRAGGRGGRRGRAAGDRQPGGDGAAARRADRTAH